jgi:uncharacterized damage-inducible protein DinB
MFMPSISQSLLDEFREEVPAVRRLLERLPNDKLTWKPHEKSRTLGELAMHVANIPGLTDKIVNFDEFSPTPPTPMTGNVTTEDIRNAFEKNQELAEKVLSTLTDERAEQQWRFTFRGKEIFRKRRVSALRTNMLNHLYHHRGQLTVYLRLLNVPLPMVYGPTADDNPFM